jgi:tryptophanyl-tRNA synthetase
VITYDPANRPGVSGLLATAAVVLGRTPEEIAEEVGGAGAGALKRLTTEVVNEYLADHRVRRAALTVADAAAVLREGNERAQSIANDTLDEVRSAMGMTY